MHRACVRSSAATPPWPTSSAHRSPMPSWSNPTPRCQRLLPSLSRSRRNVLARGAFALSRARSARAPPRLPADWSSGPLTLVPRIDLYRGIFAPSRLRARVNAHPVGRDRYAAEHPKFSRSRNSPFFDCATSVAFYPAGREGESDFVERRNANGGIATYGFVLSER